MTFACGTVISVIYNTAVVLLMAISHNNTCILEENYVSDWSAQDNLESLCDWTIHLSI